MEAEANPFEDGDEEEARRLYEGTLENPETSPRWRQAAIIFRLNDKKAHPNDQDANEMKLLTFYGYSQTRSELYSHLHDLLRQRVDDEDYLPFVKDMSQHLPQLILDKGCEVLALVGYHRKALEPPAGVAAYAGKQVNDLTVVSTGVPTRTDAYCCVSVLLVGDASLTETLVVHTSCQILNNLSAYAMWAVDRGYHVTEPFHALKDAVIPEEMKYLSPVTLQAMADVLGCNICCIAGAPTIAQTDPDCRKLRQKFKTVVDLGEQEMDTRPSELALLALYDHQGEEKLGTTRAVPLPFTCFGLVPSQYETLVNKNLLRTKAFPPVIRGRFPVHVLGKQLEEEQRMLASLGADGAVNVRHRGQRGAGPQLPPATAGGAGGEVQPSEGGTQAGERDTTRKGGAGHQATEEAAGVVAEVEDEEEGEEEEEAEEEEEVVEEEEEPFDQPYRYNPHWSEERFYDLITMRNLFETFVDENGVPMKEKPTNPLPGGLYFCRRTKSHGGVDELPEFLGAMTNAQGKGNRTSLTKYVDKTDENKVYWKGRDPPYLPVKTNKLARIGAKSKFTVEQARDRFYRFRIYHCYHLTKSGERLEVAAWV